MNRFKCYLCFSEFNDDKLTLEHLRKSHRVKEKINDIKCIVKNAQCTKAYQTWAGLKKHIITCTKSANEFDCVDQVNLGLSIENCSISNDEVVDIPIACCTQTWEHFFFAYCC